jgi:hypothetical protein
MFGNGVLKLILVKKFQALWQNMTDIVSGHEILLSICYK